MWIELANLPALTSRYEFEDIVDYRRSTRMLRFPVSQTTTKLAKDNTRRDFLFQFQSMKTEEEKFGNGLSGDFNELVLLNECVGPDDVHHSNFPHPVPKGVRQLSSALAEMF